MWSSMCVYIYMCEYSHIILKILIINNILLSLHILVLLRRRANTNTATNRKFLSSSLRNLYDCHIGEIGFIVVNGTYYLVNMCIYELC